MPSDQEYLFEVSSNLTSKKLMKKINFTLLYARYFIYTNKLHNNSILIRDFVSKISTKYILEKLDQNLQYCYSFSGHYSIFNVKKKNLFYYL